MLSITKLKCRLHIEGYSDYVFRSHSRITFMMFRYSYLFSIDYLHTVDTKHTSRYNCSICEIMKIVNKIILFLFTISIFPKTFYNLNVCDHSYVL